MPRVVLPLLNGFVFDMTVDVRMLLLVLTAIFVCDHSVDCRPESNAGIDISTNNEVSDVTKRHACDKECVYDNSDVCGRTIVIIDYTKRDSNDTEGKVIEDVPDLDKIMGGSYVAYGAIPWMAVIIYNFTVVCGGSIISEYWILSAAHCFYNYTETLFKIGVGVHRLHYLDPRERYFNIDKLIIHSSYSVGNVDYDIALIKVKSVDKGNGIKYNDYVQPICLPYSTEDPKDGTPMLFTGWGYPSSDPDDRLANILKRTILPVVDFEGCQDSYPKVKTHNVFCAGFFNGDTDICGGDSGGPATIRSGESYILYGIALSGSGCRYPNTPALFVNVAKFRDWIDQQIIKNSNNREKIMPVRNFEVAIVPLPNDW